MNKRTGIHGLIDALSWFFRIGFWLHLIFLVAQVLSAAHYDKKHGLTWDVKGNIFISDGERWEHKKAVETTKTSGAQPRVLIYKKAFALFQIQSISASQLFLIIFKEAGWIIWIFVTFQLMRIFQSLKRNNYFEKGNIQRLRIIGAIMALAPLINHVFLILFTSFAQDNLQISGYHIVLPQDIFFLPNYISVEMVTGVFTMFLFLVLTEVFRSGLELKRENDLTI